MESLVLDRINKEMIWELEKARLNVSHLWVLEFLYDNKEMDEGTLDELSRTSAYCTLQRKGYIEDDKITEDGRILYELIVSLNTGGDEALEATVERLTAEKEGKLDEAIKATVELEYVSRFEDWWLTFPSTDRVVDSNGKTVFKETRAMRTGKEYCRDKYEQAIEDGFRHDDLMLALQYEINMRKQKSFETNENQLKFMHNSKTYLYQRSFEAFIELAKENKPTREDKFDV